MNFDPIKIREDFPTLHQMVNKRPLVYFDNGATTQKPKQVIERVNQYYQLENSNIHRGVHHLSQMATNAFENARKTVQNFLNAQHSHEIIFTKGTTESINLVAHSFLKAFLKEGDEIIISAMEHHANIVPWQIACETYKAALKVIPINDAGELDMNSYRNLLSEKTKLVAVAHISNVLGTINPVKEIIQLAHEKNIPVLLDGAQAVSHTKVDVQELDCDFYVFSGHKLFAPMGVGVLYGKEKFLNQMPPYQSGGEMIKEVDFEGTTFNELPFKFEAGTPDVAGFLGLETAINYIQNIGIENIADYEHELLMYATEQLLTIEGLKIIGTAKEKASVISFVLDGIHFFDAGTILDKLGIAIRTGHHCAQPLMKRFGIPGTMRASFSFYNTKEEIDTLVKGIKQVQMMFL